MSEPVPDYTTAISELDRILRELEGSDVDIDHLAERVARASELILLCRDKITTAISERDRTRRNRSVGRVDGRTRPRLREALAVSAE